MFNKELVEAEIRDVFGSRVIVVIHFSVNRDAWIIRVYIPGEPSDEVTYVSMAITGLEELQYSGDPLDFLRSKIKTMHEAMELHDRFDNIIKTETKQIEHKPNYESDGW